MAPETTIDGFSPLEIEEMLDSGSAEFKNGQIVRVGGLEGMAIESDVETVVVWDRRDGQPSKLRLYSGNNTLMKQLAKVDQNPTSEHFGQRIFTTRRPENANSEQVLYPCYFNEAHPQYEEFRRMGVSTRCAQAYLPNEQEVDFHAQNKHPKELAAIHRAEERAREDERIERERMTAEAMLEAVRAMAEQGKAPKASK